MAKTLKRSDRQVQAQDCANYHWFVEIFKMGLNISEICFFFCWNYVAQSQRQRLQLRPRELHPKPRFSTLHFRSKHTSRHTSRSTTILYLWTILLLRLHIRYQHHHHHHYHHHIIIKLGQLKRDTGPVHPTG